MGKRKGGAVCANPSCDQNARISAGGVDVCNKHYQRWLTHGDWSLPDKPKFTTCIVHGCERAPRSAYAELCETHYYRKRRGRSDWDAAIQTKCENCSRELEHNQSRFCSKECAWATQTRERDGDIVKRLKNSDVLHRNRAKKAGCEYDVRIDLFEVCQEHNFKCAVCGKKIDLSIRHPDRDCLSIDHEVPLAAGGGHTRENVRPTHFRCNVEKAYSQDIPRAAKAKRQARLTGQQARRAAGKTKPIPQPANPWPAKGSRKLQSRGFA
jgi:hypothetical protein